MHSKFFGFDGGRIFMIPTKLGCLRSLKIVISRKILLQSISSSKMPFNLFMATFLPVDFSIASTT